MSYYISRDAGVEKLAGGIIDCLKKVNTTSRMTMEERLVEASLIYLEENLNDDRQMIFNRPSVVGHYETEDEKVRHWMNEAILAILKAVKNKDIKLNADFINEKSNGKGLTIYRHSNGTLVLKSIFSPHSILIASEDYPRLDQIVNDEWDKMVKDLNGQEFVQLEYDLRCIPRTEITKLLPSYSTGYLPDNYKDSDFEKEIENRKLLTPLNRKQEKKVIDNSSSTMSVFDGI